MRSVRSLDLLCGTLRGRALGFLFRVSFLASCLDQRFQTGHGRLRHLDGYVSVPARSGQLAVSEHSLNDERIGALDVEQGAAGVSIRT